MSDQNADITKYIRVSVVVIINLEAVHVTLLSHQL